MAFLISYHLLAVVSLPFYLKSELHARTIPETLAAAKVASSDAQLGLAFACENLLHVAQGLICEAIQADDLEDARARVTLRCAAREAFVDGDYFRPADSGFPQLVSNESRASSTLKKFTTHEHYCPVIENPIYSEFFVDHQSLCTSVSTRDPKPVFVLTAPSRFPGFFQSFSAAAGASLAWLLFLGR